MPLKFGNNPVAASTDQVQVANNAVFQDLQAFTVAMWIMPLAFDNSVNFLSYLWMKGAGPSAKQLFIDNTGLLTGHIARSVSAADPIASVQVKLNEWQFVVLTFDTANGGKLYLGFERVTGSNSILKDVTIAPAVGSGTVTADGANPMTWGNFPGQSAAANCLIEMAGLWNRVLTLQQIREQQQQMYPSEGCVNMYQFGTTGVNSNQKDLSKYNNPGVMTGKLASTALTISPKAPVAQANLRDG